MKPTRLKTESLISLYVLIRRVLLIKRDFTRILVMPGSTVVYSTGRSITRVAPATIRNTSVEDDSVLHVSVNESGSGSKSPLKQSSGHVRSNYSKSSGSRPTSTETSRQISSRPLSRSSGSVIIMCMY